ncbi:hypothetical protein P3S68_025818 [Capsicum galapagoense]
MDTSNLIIIVPITIANMFVMSAKIGKNLVGTLISPSLLYVSILMSHYILYNPFMAQTLKQEFKGLITDNDRAIEEGFQKGNLCLNVMANRIATVSASLQEFPFVCYPSAKSLDPTTNTTFHDLNPTKLASVVWNSLTKSGLWNSLTKYKSTLPHFPQTETLRVAYCG